jgi:hypothetical protein
VNSEGEGGVTICFEITKAALRSLCFIHLIMGKKQIAVIFIALQILIVERSIYHYWQLRYISVSPIVPKYFVNRISQPYLIVGLTVIPFIILTTYLYRKGKYSICIAIGVLMLIWEYFGLNLLS